MIHRKNEMIGLGTAARAMVLSVILPAVLAVCAEGAARYEAVFSDGTRLEGDKVSDWHEHPGSPRLDNTALSDPKRPLLWLRDNNLKPWRPGDRGGGYIEFIGGDRLVGRIEGVGPSAGPYVPAHLLVTPAAPMHQVRGVPARVRVLPGRIERVVFERSSPRRLQPGTIYYRDGRRLGFVSLRWRRESLVLLLKDGTREVKISDVAEAHLPRIDPWRAYFRELAVLNPDCRSRMVRIETTGGLIATGSELRFRALPYASEALEQQAMEHLERAQEHLARLQKVMKEQTRKFDQAHKEYSKQSGELEKQREASRQSYEKAKADLQRRIDRQKKKDADLLTEKRGKTDREFKSADAAMVKRLAAEKPEKRAAMLKAFRRQQAKLRKTRERVVETERARLDAQRQKELADSVARERQKLKRLEIDFQKRSRQLKARFARATSLWEHHSRSINHARLQRATAVGADGSDATWSHVIQPLWSLDALQAPFARICMRWSFAPGQVPLCRVRPAATVSPPLLPWQANRNSASRPLRSGGDEYAWGFAVHAYSELRFPLPKCASAFRSRIGLDRIVGPGGCARARVYVGSITGKPVYESPLLIGSKKTADTGRIAIKLPSEGPGHLVLQADPAHDNRPRGADPLNIRDKLDWLDPLIELDTSALQEQVRLQAAPVIAGSQGWKLKLDKRGVYTRTSYMHKPEKSGTGRFLTMIQAQGRPLRLSREMTIAPADKWLAVHVSLPTGENLPPDAVVLRVGGRQVQPRKMPIKQFWQNWAAPLLFGLDEYQGKRVTLELTQAIGGKPLHWQGVNISKELPRAYDLERMLELAGQSNLQIPQVLGTALHSRRMNDRERIALIDIYRHGGIVNFGRHVRGESQPKEIDNVLVGEDWRGGDKTFMAFGKAPSLKSLVLVKDSGVSSAAVEKLIALRPDLKVTHLERLPSTPGANCTFWMYNRTGKEVGIYWITQGGQLSLRDTLDNSGNRKRHYSNVGCRFEAHVNGKPISKFTVTPGRIWEIRPVGK